MGVLAKYTKPFFTTLPMVIWCYIAWLKRYSDHPDKYDIEKVHTKIRKAIIKIGKGFNLDLHIEGLENIPDENVCFIGNHLSDFDPLFAFAATEQPIAFVGKIEILKFPIIREAMKATKSVFIDRSDLKQTLKMMMNVSNQIKQYRKNWVIFPEGTRRKDPRMVVDEFHSGTFRTPMKSGVPIVPFAVYGTDRVFKVKPRTYRRCPVYIKFLKPISNETYSKMSTEDVAKLTREEIQKAITYDLRPKDHALMSKMYPKKYRLD